MSSGQKPVVLHQEDGSRLMDRVVVGADRQRKCLNADCSGTLNNRGGGIDVCLTCRKIFKDGKFFGRL